MYIKAGGYTTNCALVVASLKPFKAYPMHRVHVRLVIKTQTVNATAILKLKLRAAAATAALAIETIAAAVVAIKTIAAAAVVDI